VAVVLTLVQTKQIRINIHKRNNTKHSKYKYTYHRNTCTLPNPQTHTHTHTHTHTLQNKLKHSTRYTQMKQSQYNQVPSVQSHHNVHGTFIPKNFTVTHYSHRQKGLNKTTKPSGYSVSDRDSNWADPTTSLQNFRTTDILQADHTQLTIAKRTNLIAFKAENNNLPPTWAL